MIHACDEQVQEIRNMPLDSVAEMVKPTEQQRDALEQIRSAALNESESLAAACPKNVSGSFHERLDTLSSTLSAMAASLAALRPTFAQRRAKGAPCSKDRIHRRPAPVGRQISLTPKSGRGTEAWQF